jgi:hypothetical protein
LGPLSSTQIGGIALQADREDSTVPKLTAFERRLWIEVDRILYQNYLTPRVVTDFWAGDRDAVIFHLKQMKERVIRSIVIVHYVELDDVLNRTILKHQFGKKLLGRKNKKVSAVEAMLNNLYPQQKLNIVNEFLEIPKHIASHVMALNTLRNSVAHRFDLAELPKSKRLYKGKYDVFTKRGLDKFKKDMWEVDEFFQPEITAASLELVRCQREYNSQCTQKKDDMGTEPN